MHIAIDAQALSYKIKAGITAYTKSLLTSLASVDSENRYTIYLKSSPYEDLSVRKDNFRIKEVNVPQRRIFGADVFFLYRLHILLPLELIRDRPDIFFSPVGCLPLYCPCKTVATIHDVTPLVSKDFFTTQARISYKLHTSHTIKRADRIITISECTKKDIISFFHADPDKISVVYAAHDPKQYYPRVDLAQRMEIMQRYHINTNYILYVGTLEPRKNIARLIEAFSLVKKWGLGHKLVIAGQKGWLYEMIVGSVQRFGLQNEVIFTGYVNEADVPVLMSNADVFVFPSLYEGFGLPPLEAMACGTPVITSNVASLPEVVGDAAILVNPRDVFEMATAMHRVLSDAAIQLQMRQKGLERAKLFSGEKEAQQILEVFENLVRHSNGDFLNH